MYRHRFRDSKSPPKSRKKLSIICTAGMIICAFIMLVPFMLMILNQFKSSQSASDYSSQITRIDSDLLETQKAEAQDYNQKLRDIQGFLNDEGKQLDGYDEALNVNKDGMMGILTIPKIDLTIPVYHGTSDSSLSMGAGHLQSTFLPIGGEGTHAVITGHRGLPTDLMFTRLNEVEAGDVFSIQVLDETLWYKTEKIQVIMPDELDKIQYDPAKDEVTLVTCTPFGVNNRRLLVTGIRTEQPADPDAGDDAENQSSSFLNGWNFWILPALLLGFAAAGFIWVFRKRG